MATHSSVLVWRIPGMGKPGGLPSMGSHRVGHDWSDIAAAAAFLLIKIIHSCVLPIASFWKFTLSSFMNDIFRVLNSRSTFQRCQSIVCWLLLFLWIVFLWSQYAFFFWLLLNYFLAAFIIFCFVFVFGSLTMIFLFLFFSSLLVCF